MAGLLAVLTLSSGVAVSLRLRLDPNVATLLPQRGESAGLVRYLRAFGGSDLAMVLVSAPDASDADARVAEVEEVAQAIAGDMAALASVKLAAAGMDTAEYLDPLLVWRHADAPARALLARALSAEGMRERLRRSRAMLLAPGGGGASEQIARDPLRLTQVLAEARAIGSGFRTQPDGSFASDDGLARLVLVFPRGQALRGGDAKQFVHEAREVLERHGRAHPELYIGLTGGHAIAEATERMLMRDLTISGSLSMVLASLAFALTFRRFRALVAVMPPLFLGTLWTAGIAASLPSGLSAIAVAFMSVVIGVGVDTGVHVYAALLEARREGLAPRDAASAARTRTLRPVLVAAVTAGAAFGALGLSEIAALRQLGILCAGGEVLTAVAIVVITPEIGGWLERGDPPAARPPRWASWVARLTADRRLAVVCVVLTLTPVALSVIGFAPRLSEAIVAMRPSGLEPLAVQQRVYDEFGGRPGQWVVLVSDLDREAARERADRIAEKLSTIPEHIDSLDALTAVAPAPSTQRARLAERDALGLPGKAALLEAALQSEGFAPARFEEVLDAMRSPPAELVDLDQMQQGKSAIMLSRYLGTDGDDHLVVVYVLPRSAGAQDRQHEAAIENAVRDIDPTAVITGYGRLEASLRATLLADMPLVGLVAAVLVVAALAFSLRRLADVLIALAVVGAEIGIVLFLVRLLDVPLHAYDALVLPVLLGITVDEAMFLLYRAREAKSTDVVTETLRHEGPLIATTALTTAAGFGALVLCDFDGLRHLGMVGAIGSLTGLVVALVIVPAGLRLRRGGALAST